MLAGSGGVNSRAGKHHHHALAVNILVPLGFSFFKNLLRASHQINASIVLRNSYKFERLILNKPVVKKNQKNKNSCKFTGIRVPPHIFTHSSFHFSHYNSKSEFSVTQSNVCMYVCET